MTGRTPAQLHRLRPALHGAHTKLLLRDSATLREKGSAASVPRDSLEEGAQWTFYFVKNDIKTSNVQHENKS
jgi:hypothetical protein